MIEIEYCNNDLIPFELDINSQKKTNPNSAFNIFLSKKIKLQLTCRNWSKNISKLHQNFIQFALQLTQVQFKFKA